MRDPQQVHPRLRADKPGRQASPLSCPASSDRKITYQPLSRPKPKGVLAGKNRAPAASAFLPSNPLLGKAVFPVEAQSAMWAGSVRYCKLMTRLPTEPSSVGASLAGKKARTTPRS